jgi:exosortase E/protease (VPEID-CTERM system)
VIARQVRARAGLIAGTAVLGLIAFLVGRLAQGLWMPLRQATFSCAAFVLGLLSPTAVADPATLELGAQQFVVEIAPQCSGYEGVGLTWAFVLAALWLFRARLRFPAALLLLLPATLLPFVANIGRLVSLVLLGAYVSPELAEGGFHSYAGSILFCAVALGIVALGLRMTFFARDRDTARSSDDIDDVTFGAVAGYLLPFLAMTAAGLVSRAFSGGDSEPLFALRPAAGLIALVLLNREYRALVRGLSPSLIALAGGLGVAALWLAMDRVWPAAETTGMATATAGPAMLARALSAILLVPIVEELAFRGFLARRICAAAFDRVDAAALPWRGIVISAVAFGLLHHRPLAGIAAGLAYGMIYRRRGVLGDAVVAHAATNAALVLVAWYTGRWDLWT